MQQYFVSGTIQLRQPVFLSDEQRHHIQTVLRMREHSQIRLVDESAQAYLAELHLQNGVLTAIPIQMIDVPHSTVKITLALALIKGERWDYALQKCSELGVHSIQPLITSRCVVKPKAADMAKKLKRWNRITMEACEQCHRADLVTVNEPCSLSQLERLPAAIKLLAYEHADAGTEHIVSIVKQNPQVHSILVAIGPEGGFTADEVNQLHAQGFQNISLGQRILRAETAALAAVNLLSLLYEN